MSGQSWDHALTFLNQFERFWGFVGAILEQYWSSWPNLPHRGATLGPFWASLGISWVTGGHLELPGGHLGTKSFVVMLGVIL